MLGKAGEKDVDLKSVIVQHNLPGRFPEEVRAQARRSVDTFDPDDERDSRFDLTDEIICTIDPDDAKDYDDAISLRKLDNGEWELGVHIADVSHFVPEGSPLDEEAARARQQHLLPRPRHPDAAGDPQQRRLLAAGRRAAASARARSSRYDEDAQPVGTKFANTIIKSRKRLRYREAQAIIDGAEEIPHPDGDRSASRLPDRRSSSCCTR